MERKLATIMVADIVGSTSAMEIDEERAVANISSCLKDIGEIVANGGGRVFNTAGDAILAEFASPVNALQSAITSRSALSSLKNMKPEGVRIGLHLADVIVQGSDLRGDGVNIAARIQSNAEPGEIEVSGALFELVRRSSPCVFDDLGEKTFKGISEPIKIYRIRETTDRFRYQVAPTKESVKKKVKLNSIVVLPLVTASSSDEEQQYLADGLTDDLTLELSRFHTLFVSSRSAASAVDSSDPVEIGLALGVEYILSGSVRKLGDRIRFNISLVETKKGNIIWSDRIQRQFDDVFDIMDEITAHVSATVSGRIEHAATAAVQFMRPENMSAYECYLRGIEQHRMGGVTDEHVYEAIGWFDKAITLDPNFGRPYAMHICSLSYLPDFDIGKAEKQIAKALELDPTDPEAHRIMGIVQIKVNRDYDASRIHHEKACELAPNDAYILGRCAAFYIFIGEIEKALSLLDKAEVLDPYLPVWVTEERIAALYCTNNLEEMQIAANSLQFQTRRTRIYKAAALMELGKTHDAKLEVKEALLEDPSLSAEYIRYNELYKDETVLELLVKRACAAGLPHAPLVQSL